MTQSVYVVTDTELGWNCVVGVYLTKEEAVAECGPSPEEYEVDKEWYDSQLNEDGMWDSRIIHEKRLGGW